MRRCVLARNPAGFSAIPYNCGVGGERVVHLGGKAFRGLALISCIAAVILLSNCGGSNSSSSSSSSLKLSLANGSQQNTVVGTAFGQKFSVVVTNAGSPVSGVTVSFAAPTSGASGTFANGSAGETDTTGSNGIATSSTFTANSTAGSYMVSVSVQGVPTVSGFSVTNDPALVLAVNPTNGSPQAVLVGRAFSTPLSAVVTQNGTPLSGVTVTFTAPASGASGTFSNNSITESYTTDSKGVVTSSTFSANSTPGVYTVSATISGGSKPATFSLTNLSLSALTIVSVNGSPQSVLVGTRFPTQLQAGVFSSGVPVSGVTVTFTAPSSGASGTFSSGAITENNTTDSNGTATSSAFTANSTSGAYTVSAAISGGSSSARFGLTNLSTSDLTIVSVDGSQQSTKVGMPFSTQLEAGVFYSGVPVSGVTVTFTAPSSGASGTFSHGMITESDVTDSNGHATSSTFTANPTTGSYSVNATLSGNATPAVFTLTNLGPTGVFATGGTPQRASVGGAFAHPLVATVVDQTGSPVSGISVTFTAPNAGVAAGTFSNGTNTENDVTDANGHATSSTFTANATPGAYNVTATTGTLAPANFVLSNTKSGLTLTSYAFYLSGQEKINSSAGINSYVLAGAVTVDQNGLVTGGVQDYNDGFGLTSPQPSGDVISSGTLIVDATGQGTLTLATNNLNLGVAGVEVFGVQFVNTSHALILQFDGTATSSGSLDVQNLSTAPSNSYAFTISGATSSPFAIGGVFAFGGNLLNPIWPGTSDTNFGGTVTKNSGFSAQLSAVDLYGRGQMSGLGLGVTPLTLNYYQVGPEALRIVDVDPATAAIGSAFGQGPIPTNFGTAGLGTSVFSIVGNPHSNKFGVLGQFTTTPSKTSTSTFAGVADDNELGNATFVSAAPISGSYTMGTNGYGSLTITAGQLGSISVLGLYLTDPNLNLNDPNNSSGGGGGLLVDLDPNQNANATLAGGTGFVTPQTDTSTASFNGNYAAGWQYFDLTGAYCCEVDTGAQGTVTAGTMNLTGLVSDPFDVLTGSPTTSGDGYLGTPFADSANPGRSTMFSTNATPNPLKVTIGSKTLDYNVVVYQASGEQLFWLDADSTDVFLGPVEQQGSLNGIPAVRKRTGQ